MSITDTRTFLSLGASLGRREETVLRAVRIIVAEGVARVVAASSLYETSPHDVNFSDYFINATIQVQPLLSPVDLLKRLKTIENQMGRVGGHNAPREIDIDIITYGDVKLEAADLRLPHPRYRERAFVLTPLREIAPWFRCPTSGRCVDELIASLATPGKVTRITRRALVERNAS